MKFLCVLLIGMPLMAKPSPKPEVLPLKEGPVKEVLKKHYKLHLVRNFQQEADRELERKVSETRKARP